MINFVVISFETIRFTFNALRYIVQPTGARVTIIIVKTSNKENQLDGRPNTRDFHERFRKCVPRSKDFAKPRLILCLLFGEIGNSVLLENRMCASTGIRVMFASIVHFCFGIY